MRKQSRKQSLNLESIPLPTSDTVKTLFNQSIEMPYIRPTSKSVSSQPVQASKTHLINKPLFNQLIEMPQASQMVEESSIQSNEISLTTYNPKPFNNQTIETIKTCQSTKHPSNQSNEVSLTTLRSKYPFDQLSEISSERSLKNHSNQSFETSSTWFSTSSLPDQSIETPQIYHTKAPFDFSIGLSQTHHSARKPLSQFNEVASTAFSVKTQFNQTSEVSRVPCASKSSTNQSFKKFQTHQPIKQPLNQSIEMLEPYHAATQSIDQHVESMTDDLSSDIDKAKLQIAFLKRQIKQIKLSIDEVKAHGNRDLELLENELRLLFDDKEKQRLKLSNDIDFLRTEIADICLWNKNAKVDRETYEKDLKEITKQEDYFVNEIESMIGILKSMKKREANSHQLLGESSKDFSFPHGSSAAALSSSLSDLRNILIRKYSETLSHDCCVN